MIGCFGRPKFDVSPINLKQDYHWGFVLNEVLMAHDFDTGYRDFIENDATWESMFGPHEPDHTPTVPSLFNLQVLAGDAGEIQQGLDMRRALLHWIGAYEKESTAVERDDLVDAGYKYGMDGVDDEWLHKHWNYDTHQSRVLIWQDLEKT